MPLPVMRGAVEVPGGMKRPASQDRPWVTGETAPPRFPLEGSSTADGQMARQRLGVGKVASDRPLTARLNVHMNSAAPSQT